MQIMKSALFIAGLLCLLLHFSCAQPGTRIADQSAPTGGITKTLHPSNAPEASLYSGPAGGPSIAWHHFRQHRSANDIAPGLVATWDLPLVTFNDDALLTVRPGLSYLHPTVLFDAVLRLQYSGYGALMAGFSIDPSGDREFRFEENTPEWEWMNEHDSFGKRSFAVLGLQLPTSFAYYEFLYRIQLEKGSQAYYVGPDQSTRVRMGLRRYFLLSVGMGIWL